jgi:hypothetical protein
MHSRTGAAPGPSTEPIMSRCSTESTMTIGASWGFAALRIASSLSAPVSAVG